MEVFRTYEERDFQRLCEMVLGLYEEDPPGQEMNEEKIRKTLDQLQKFPEK